MTRRGAQTHERNLLSPMERHMVPQHHRRETAFLYDNHGQRIKGRHNEPAAKKAYARLLIAHNEASSQSSSTEPDAGDIVADYVEYIQRRVKASSMDTGYGLVELSLRWAHKKGEAMEPVLRREGGSSWPAKGRKGTYKVRN